MKIKLYRSSTVGIHFKNFKILTDPWLTDGEYYGSWVHFPPFDIKKNLKELNSYDAIYISHIHPDHCSEKTLSYFNKNMPIYIHKFHSPFLKFKIEKLGFKVTELENGIKHKISKDVSISIYAADNCNPKLCYKFTGCANLNVKNQSQQIDTLAVIADKKNVIVNLNDCPFDLARHPILDLKKKYPNVDILLTGYGGAGPYPQCFDNLNRKEKLIEANKKKINFLKQAIKFIKIIKPKFYLPYAGTYTLSGHLSKKQFLRGVPTLDETYKYIDNYLYSNLNNKKINSIKIGPDQTFDIKNFIKNKPYEPINLEKQKKYIKNILKFNKLDYENDNFPKKKEIFDLAKNAYQNYLDKKILFNSTFDFDILIDCIKYQLLLPKNNSNITIKEKAYIPRGKFIKLKLDTRLLYRILKGPKFAHWNNAEIGSHIRYYRKPNEFNRNLHLSLCYFHN